MKKYKSNREEKMSEIQERLMAGTKEIYESGKWAEYISVMSKFPHYSINNCILIASQCPHASYICGYKKWNEFNRNVLKGESGIMIFAPIKGKVETEEPKFDENAKPVLNEDGTQQSEKVTREYKTFRPCYVFDLSQTEGDPLPTLANRLEESVEDYEKLKDILISVSPVPVSFEEVPGSANGFYSPTEMRIVVQDISYGTNYPPTAAEGARMLEADGRKVSAADLKPGDLIYYGGEANGRYLGIYHVAIYVGDGMAVEALCTKYGVVYQPLRTKNACMICRPK